MTFSKAFVDAYAAMGNVPTRNRNANMAREHKYTRRKRGVVRVNISDKEIVYRPIPQWAARLNVSVMTIYNWLSDRTITAEEMYSMPVMCDAELVALRAVIDRHKAIIGSDELRRSDTFTKDAHTALLFVRSAIAKLRRQIPLTSEEQAAMRPSMKEL